MGQCESLEDMWAQKEDVESETITSPLLLLATEARPILHPKDPELKKCRFPRHDNSILQVFSTLPDFVPFRLYHGSAIRCIGVQGSLIESLVTCRKHQGYSSACHFILVTDISSEGFDG